MSCIATQRLRGDSDPYLCKRRELIAIHATNSACFGQAVCVLSVTTFRDVFLCVLSALTLRDSCVCVLSATTFRDACVCVLSATTLRDACDSLRPNVALDAEVQIGYVAPVHGIHVQGLDVHS